MVVGFLGEAHLRAGALGADGEAFAVFDIGFGKISCFIARLNSGAMNGAPFAEILGVAHHASAHVTPSGQLELGAEGILRNVLASAERMAGERVTKAAVAIGGTSLKCRKLAVALEIDGLGVMQEDVTACLKEGAKQATNEDGMTALHIWPSSFSIDGAGQIKDPRGLLGDILTVELTCLNTAKALLRNITETLARCEIDAVEFFAAPYAAGVAALLDDEMDIGVLMMDIGARTTSFAVLEEGSLHLAGAIPIGGAHVTSDISKTFSISISASERLKTMHGSVVLEPGDEVRIHEIAGLTAVEGVQNIAQSTLAEVMAARLAETFERIQSEIEKSGVKMENVRRVVLAGGTSQLGGMVEMAEATFGMRARLGKPLNAFSAPEATSGGGFSVCAGMVDCIVLRHNDHDQLDLAATKVGKAVVGQWLSEEGADYLPSMPQGRLKSVAGWLRNHF